MDLSTIQRKNLRWHRVQRKSTHCINTYVRKNKQTNRKKLSVNRSVTVSNQICGAKQNI